MHMRSGWLRTDRGSRLLFGIVIVFLLGVLGFSQPAFAHPQPQQAPPRNVPVIKRSIPSSTPSHGRDNPNRRDTAMPPDIQRILDRGTLVVAMLGQDNAPFFMEDTQQLKGLDVEIAQAVAEQLGVSLVIDRSAQTFDEVVDTVYQLEADLAFSKISRTLKRARKVRFSRPYLQMRQGLLVNRLQLAQQTQGRSMVETIRQLQGQVGVIQASSYVGFLKQKFPQATVVEFPTWTDIVDAVVQGKVLAAYRDELEIKKVVRTQPDAALQLQTIALTDARDSLAAVLPWDSTHLLAFVDQYLETMAPQPSVDELLDEYDTYWSAQRSQQSLLSN